MKINLLTTQQKNKTLTAVAAVMAFVGATEMQGQTNPNLPTNTYNTLKTRVFNGTNQNIDAAYQVQSAELHKIWRQSTQLRAFNHQYDIESFDDTFIDRTNMPAAAIQFKAWTDGDIINGEPGCTDCDDAVDMVLQLAEDTGSNRGRTFYNFNQSSATVHDIKAISDTVIYSSSTNNDEAHEGGHRKGVGQVSGQPDHPYGIELAAADVEVFVNGNWIPYPLNFPIKTIMHSGSGRKIATNLPQYSTAGEDGFVNFEIDDGTGSGVMFPARTQKNNLTNSGLESLPTIAANLAPGGELNFRIFAEPVPNADKIELKTPQISLSGDVLSLANASDFNATRNGVPVEYEYFLYNSSDTTDGSQIPRNNVAANVGFKLDESVDLTDYGFSSSNLPAIRVLAIGQNGLSLTNTLGVEDYQIDGLKVYPNPVEDILTINANEDINEIIIYNMLGQVVLNQQPNSRQNSIDLGHLQTGIYLAKLKTDNGVTTKRIMKK